MPVERRQKLRGTTAQLNATQGLLGLLTVDISTMGLRVFDGVTMGGFAIPNKATNDAAYVPQSRLVQGSEGISAGGDLGSNVMLELAGQARTLHDWQDTGILFHTGSEGEYRPILLTTGLEINDVDIGGTMTLVMTPDATVVRTSGEQTIAGGLTAFEDDLYITGAAGTLRALRFSTGNNDRFSIGIGSAAESGANAGSNLLMQAYDDAGAVLGTVLSINRATRVVTFDQPIVGSGAQLTDVVLPTRQVATGAGLSGGGSLAADLTLTVDATVVRTSGSQTIGGTKTFTSSARIGGVGTKLQMAGAGPYYNVAGINGSDVLEIGSDSTLMNLFSSGIMKFVIGGVDALQIDANGALRSLPTGSHSFLAQAGAANQPGYSFVGTGSKGMYATASGLGFSVGNTLRGEITTSGFEGAGGGLTGLNASQLTTGTVPAARLNIATTAEAEAGTGNTQVMTPLRVKEYYDKRRNSDADHSETTGDTTMPIGSYVLVNMSTTVSRNAVIDVRISNGGTFEFVNGAHPDAGTALAGTWRARGYRLLGGTERIAFAQRVA